ncbi:hypothetical protein [Hymenobacter sublimis]|uniref:Uncharacterized protein n=1 Tax=Hymenobacter sublimis TaxID=2933777 RepID=A0ABY4JBB8_9BACT|nr:hypothetical protein [Hymenobacter sublimis]UPL49756.1 hypothetical protein MWH26_02310 [Hymenobacter sublimis]
MKNSDQEQPAKKAKKEKDPTEKAQRKAAKAAKSATSVITDARPSKKATQKKALKIAAKQLQKQLDSRIDEVVKRIRKETKAKLKEVVQDATRRLDVDMEQLFEQALHTIVRHHEGGTLAASDSVSTFSDSLTSESAPAATPSSGVGARPTAPRAPRPNGAVAANGSTTQAAAARPNTKVAAVRPAPTRSRPAVKKNAPNATPAPDSDTNSDGVSL